ncbi:hypothetical protein DL93DRAFT_2074236 [Clavulina sp. PMI_390]|nr:hypothetical protein DL93DRAFT_2074236 [Clavulina sp. PMI_390]
MAEYTKIETPDIPSTVTFQCSNKSLRNTVITSPDGQTSYIIETPLGWLPHPSTLSKRVPGKVETDPVTQQVATVEWRYWTADKVLVDGKEPTSVNVYFPRKWYNW